MSAEKATALVLRLIDFSETSAVVTLFSREFGKLSALAKGAGSAKRLQFRTAATRYVLVSRSTRNSPSVKPHPMGP